MFDEIIVEQPTLRPYQDKGIEDLRGLIAQGVTRIVLVLPTGGGKTVIAAKIIELARKLGKTVLFVAHRIELINQTARQLAKFGVTDIGIIRGNDDRSNPDAPIQIASIDTLRNRVMPHAEIVFIDECHRAMSDSYRVLFAHYVAALHIGLTATPFRTDNQGLGEVYQSLVTCAKPSQLIEDKFIVAPRIFCAPEFPDISGVEVSFGTNDFHNQHLGLAMSKPQLLGNMVEEWKKHAQGRRTVVFAVNVEHSKKIVEAFRESGVAALHIDGTTTIAERETALLRLESNEISIISNCDVLSEGWDQPSVRCAILARPTQSTRLHLQQCGRILRWYDGDVISDAPTGALILDHAGNCLRHGLPQQDRVFDLAFGQSKKEEGPSLHVCKSCFAMWTGTSIACPECGAHREQKERKEIQSDATVELKEMNTPKILTIEDQQRQFYLKELTKCRDMGKKVGAAAYKYKEKYSKWPPYSWTAQAKQLYEASPDWQQAVSTRETAKAFWQQRNADRTAGANHDQPENSSFKDEGYTEEVEPSNYWQGVDDDIPF